MHRALLLLPVAFTFLYLLPFIGSGSLLSAPAAHSSSLRRAAVEGCGPRATARAHLLSLVGLGGGWAVGFTALTMVPGASTTFNERKLPSLMG